MIRSLFGLLAAGLLALSPAGCANHHSGGSGGSASAATATSPVLSRVIESGMLRVGMSGNQPPLNAKSRDGEMIGLEPDLARLLAGAIGVEAKLIQKPFSQLIDALEDGDVDMVMSGMTITPERNLRVAFVGPYFVSGKSILTKSETLAQADETADIDNPSVKLAALAGSTSQRFVEIFVPKAELVATSDYDQGVDLVRKGKVDAFVADYPICVLSVLRYPSDGLVTLVAPLSVEPIGIALPSTDPLFVNLVQNYVSALQATGALEELRKVWFENGAWLSQLP